jgi:hypothetical protein
MKDFLVFFHATQYHHQDRKCSFASQGPLTLSNLTLYEVSSSKESCLVNDNGEEKESVPHEALG